MDLQHEENLRKYADLIVKVGLNIQPSQQLVVRAPLEAGPLVRAVAASAYRTGCRLVTVVWNDEQLQLLRLQNAPRDSFEEFPSWIMEGLVQCLKRGDAYLQVIGMSPDLLKDQDPGSVTLVNRTFWRHYAPILDLQGENAINWCVVAAPIQGWAEMVFPGLDRRSAVSRLWDAIFETCRVNHPDPLVAWESHLRRLEARCDYLNRKQYSCLKYNGPGTDLTVGLPRSHVWAGARLITKAGVPFVANLPTEEIFTSPHRNRVDGVAKATMPLSYAGTLIDGFSLTFAEGRVTAHSARTGEEVLKGLIQTDEGAARLGEVALVPITSPICRSGILFYNTLFDENASSHLAIGSAERTSISGGDSMSEEAFAEAGGNSSAIHIDFMIGSSELDVDGIDEGGLPEPVMHRGEWVFEV